MRSLPVGDGGDRARHRRARRAPALAVRAPQASQDTNLLERTFVEVRRRTKVIGRFPGETSALSLIWAVLELSSRGWRGVVMTPKTVAAIERLRRQRASAASSDDANATEGVVAA
jgi:transposase-like protein